ncbi:TagK domain-containing protein [Rosenbergiella epipactidis]|uniref:TagK domain-containing protein n=1 Tax=Rosenbergiella epipactidis TaxID=1544694 RepID=UPI001F4FB9B4|nr:TagK domain-containing protein [Rosenbergiella epipactidis]
MQLCMDWPRPSLTGCPQTVILPEQTGYFCLKGAEFITTLPAGRHDVLYIDRTEFSVVLVCHSQRYQCLVNDEPLQPGKPVTLRTGMVIQVGLFLFNVKAKHRDMLPEAAEGEPVEITSLLPHGGHYTGWHSVNGNNHDLIDDGNILRQLNLEYKYHLLWGEGDSTAENNTKQQQDYSLKSDDDLYDSIEQVKHKTVTECVLNTPALTSRIIEELTESADLIETEWGEVSSPDILAVLAPEYLKKIQRSDTSELIYSELHKLGLYSHM